MLLTKSVRPSLAALFLALAGLLLTGGPAMSQSMSDDGIHVSGRGEIRVEPDIARFSLQVTRQGRDAAALKKEMDRITARVLKLTDSLGIDRKDVTAAMVNIQPNRVHHEGRQSIDGVIANRSISVTLRELERIGELMNQALESGINSIGGVQLDTSRRTEIEGEALDAAIEDAQALAARAAKGFGVRLSGVRRVHLTGGHMVRPQMARSMEMMSDGGDSFSAGEIVISREIQAVFDIGGQ